MPVGTPHISDVIAAIGRPDFPKRLLSLMFDIHGVEACAMYRLKRTTPIAVVTSSVGSPTVAQRQADTYLRQRYWLRDPAMLEACGNATNGRFWTSHMDVRAIEDQAVRDAFKALEITERLVVCDGRRAQEAVLTLVKTNASGGFSDRQRAHIERNAPTLMASLSRHIELTDCASGVSTSLTSLQQIETCIAASERNLPRREAQVASRIIYGMSHAGIAIDLAIGEETVTTYRKRLYRRLSIGSQRELIAFYLRQWSASRGAFGSPANRGFAKVGHA